MDSYSDEKGRRVIVLEFCPGGELLEYLHLDENRIQHLDAILSLYVQILLAVEYMNHSHIAHRDLKPSNCFISERYSTIAH